ncbi:MAG: filamentous hemagglutinin N-terminal domain-containing protein [Gammaproteobacteria bacterium]
MSTQDSRPVTAAAFTRFSLKPIARSVQLALLAGVAAPALAAPTGGQVRAGSADISTPARGMTVINQRSQRAAIDWRSFDVARNETVRFNQPNAKASALNRIFDQKPSEIFGQIKSNGEVILLNPNGVFFKPGAEVRVGSLIAAAMNVGIDDFMRGRYRLEAQAGSDGRVLNQGRIEAAPGGDVALLGRTVANEGVIVATAGRVSLLAGEKTTVDFDGDGLLRFSVDEVVVENARKLADQVTNTGEIRADGGQILITARAAEGVFKHAINNGGLIQAGRIDKQGGKVRLTGLGPGASVLNTGTLDASAADIDSRGGRVVVAADTIEQRGRVRADAAGDRGGSVKLVGKSRVMLGEGSEVSVTSAAAKGGTVKAAGEQLELNFDAEVDASGARGGGQVLLGGGARGEASSVPNATTTFVGGAARIAADATVSGDGGEVVVWADGSTWFYGQISAKGGPAGGDGGFVEVSGRQNLLYRGQVDATAPQGAKGTLLLDPTTLSIIDAATGGEEDAELPDILEADDAPGGANTVSWGEIVAQGAAADIVLEATNDITINDVTGAAGGAITANDLVTLPLDNGSLTLRSVSGDIVFNDVNDVIRTEGGAIAIQAGGSVTLGGFDTTGVGGAESGDLSISTGAGGSLGGVIDLGSGTLTVAVTAGTLTQGATADIVGDADVIKSGSGVLVLAAVGNSYTGDTDITAGTLRLGDADVLPNTTDVTIDTLATFDLNDFSEAVASVSGNASATLDMGSASLIASGNLDLRGTNILIAGGAGDTALTAGGTLQLDDITKTNTGDLTLTATGGIELGDDVSVQAGALVLASSFTASGDLTASTNITFQGNGTFDGATQTVTATAGNITDAAGQVQSKTSAGNLVLNAGGDIGVSAANRLGVAVTGGGVLRVNAANVFAESASTLTVDALTTSGAGANSVNIATTGTAALSLTGSNSANLANDSITLSAAGDLTISTSNALAGATVALTAGTGVATATLDLNAVVSGTTSVSLTGAAAASTLDLAGLSGALTITASGDGTGNITGGLTASYSGIDALVGGTGVDTLVGFTNYSITGSNSGTATTPGTMAWSGIENLTGTAGDNVFTLNGGSLSGVIDGLGETTADKIAGYTTYVVNAANGGTATAAAVTTNWQGIEDLDGSAGADSFTLAAGGSLRRLDALGDDDTVTLTGAASVTTMVLGSGNDTLDLSGFALTTGVDGGTGTNTIQGATAFTINAVDGGSTGSTNFSLFQNVSGTTGADTFTISAGGRLTGTLDGLGDNDLLQGSAAYTLSGANSGTFGATPTNWQNIESLTGTTGSDTFVVAGGSVSGTVDGAGGSDTLRSDTLYMITGANIGSSSAVTAWQSIENLEGTTGADTFTFNAGGSITGTASGLAGDDVFNLAGAVGGSMLGGDGADTFTLTAATTTALNGGNDGDSFNLAGFTLTGAINGNTGVTTGSESDTITGATTYVGTGAGSGTSTQISGGWSNIENLTGTSGVDSFTFNSGGSISGTVSGLGGNDTFSLAGVVNGTMSGGDGADTFTLTANSTSTLAGGNDADTFALGNFTLTGSINGGTGASTGSDSDTVSGAPNYTITGANSGTSTRVTLGWSEVENLTGSSASDTFTFTTGTLSGTIDGLGDAFALSGGEVSNRGDDIIGNTAYTIDGAGQGTAGSATPTSFVNIESLTGSLGADTFTFQANGALTGNASGSVGADAFVVDGDSSAHALEGNSGNDTFTFQTGSTTFTGDVYGETEGVSGNFADLNTFVFKNRARLIGDLNGGTETGAGSENDVLDFSQSAILNTINVVTSTGNVTEFSLNLEGESVKIISGTITDTLQPTPPAGIFTSGFVNAFWYITGVNTGFVSDSLANLETLVAGGVESFTSVDAISGGTGNDVFIFLSGGRMTATVSGGGGSDSLVGSIGIDAFTVTGSTSVTVNIDVSGANLATAFSGIANIDGSAGLGGGGAADARFGDVGNDTITVTGQTWAGQIKGGGGTDTLVGATQYTVNAANAGTSTAITGGWSEVEILTGTSGVDSFTFAAGGALTGIASGLGGADVFTLTGAASAATLSGGDDADSFDLGGFALTGAIDGGNGGTDTDTVSNATNFTLTGADSGTSTQVSGGFTEVENLTGTTGADSFVFNAGSSLSGTASGGAGADSFVLAGNASALSLTGGSEADSFDLGGFTLTGAIAGGTESDTLLGSDTYVVTASNTGTSPDVSLGWSAVENLTGTAGADSFTFNAGSQLGGTADGLAGVDVFTLAGTASVTLIQGGDDGDTFDLGGFTLTGVVNGGSGGTDDDLVTGADNFTVTGADTGTSGRVSGGFSEIENLTGTSGSDSFTFNAGSALTGDARGASGTDTFTLAGNASAGRLIGGAGSDTFNLAGFTLTGQVDGTAGDSDVLTGANNYVVTGTDSGTSTQVSGGFSNVENLTGTAGVDSFSFDAGAALTGTASGLAGADTFTLNGSASSASLSGGSESDSFVLNGFTLTGAIDGGANTDTLSGADNYTLTLANGGTSTLVSGGFSNVENLTGTAGDDTFDVGTGSITGTLDGLGGDDLLTGSTSYTVTGSDTGAATGVTLWQNIENLTGTNGNDSFTFNAGSALSGDARGASGTDTFTLAGNASAGQLIGGAGSDTFNLAGFTLTGQVDGTAGDSDVLTGANNYVVTGTDSGTSTQVSGGFSNVENLTGTAGVDSFTFTAGGQLTGTADGLGNADSFVLGGNASAGLLQGGAGDDSVDLGGFTLTGAVDGGANNDTLTGADNYTLTGANAGTSSRASGGFSNVENLTGTGGADTFTFQGGSSLTGTAAGGGGADSFVLTGNASAGSLTGNGGDDTFDLGGATLTGSIDGGSAGSDVLRGSDNYILTGVNSGTSSDVSGAFTDIENLTGTAGNDTFTVNGGTLSGTVNGLGGAGDRIVGDTSYVINGPNSGFSGALTAFVNIKSLSGTGGADTFNFQGGSLAGAADGLGGADTFNITASGGAATMQLNGGDNDDVFNFANDAVLTGDINGGNGNDIVNFGTPNADPPNLNTDKSRLIGRIDLGAGAGDRLDISGSNLFTAVAVDSVVSANGRSGTITGIEGDPDLLSDGFAGVDDLRGNGKGAIVGANAATFWRVTGTNRGEFSTSSGDIGAPGAAAGANGASTFINFAIRGGTAADTYIFDSAGFIEIGITDTGGANVLVGSAGADTFTLTGARTVDFNVNGSGNTTTVEALAGSLDIDGSVTTLRFPGDTGNDSFVFSGNTNWRGALNGGGGVDTLDLTARTQAATATVSGINAQGLVSTNADFAGEFRNIEVLNSGAGDDVITLAVDPTGNATSIDTGAGIDEIRSTVDATWVVTGDGVGVIRAGNGPGAANQVQFSGLENLTSTGDATLTLPSSAGAAASLAGAFTADRVTLTPGAVFTGDLGLRIDAPVTSNGSLTLNLGNGNLEMRDSLTVNGNFRMVGPFGDFQAVNTTGSQTYVGEAQLNGNLNAGGDLSFSTFLTIVGNVALNSATNVFDFNGEVQGNTDAVLSIVPTANTDMFIDLEDGPGHIAADRFDTFRGTLVIGGLFEATPDRDLLAGTLRSAPADYITVSSSLVTGGDLMLVGSTVDFSQGVGLEIGSTATTGGDVAILALGDAIQVGNNGVTGGVALGNITGTPGSTTMRFLGNRVMLAARGEIQNSTNMIMALAGGEVLVAQSSQAVQQQVNFNVQSNATPSTENVTDTALVVSLGQIPGAQITSPTGLFQNARVFFPNPAAIITILQAVAFVDSSLFEEDLSLFGVIGDGIAKSLDQCEDAEGCAPSVTAEQLAELIGGIDARIATLEKELASGDIDRAKGETLLARYRAERKNYTDYQAQLEAYLARQAEEQSGGDEFDDVFEAEETPDGAPAAPAEEGAAPDAEEAPSLEENSEDLFAPLEDSPAPEAAPAAPAAPPDVDEGFEMLEDAAPAAAPSAPAAPAVPAAPASDDGGDDFEELEELPDATLLNDTLTPGTVNQLAGMLRLDARGAVTWEGDVLLPTLHRRY